jgi:hypothetical protein
MAGGYLFVGRITMLGKLVCTSRICTYWYEMIEHARGEQYGPSFIKRNENGHLYKCQMFRACNNSIKENAWVRDYGIDLKEVCRAHLNTYTDLKVKGFMWLFTSHALLVGTRLRGKDACNRCLYCMEVEDIKHMAYDCCVAQYIRKKVFKEWWFHTTESRWYNHPTFEEAFFSEGTSVLRRTLNDIATYHIWKLRCNILYREELILSVVTANNIWVEFTQTLKVRLSHIKAKANWWTYRDIVQMVPKAIDQNLEKIEVEQSVLLALFPDWECPRSGIPVSLETLNSCLHTMTMSTGAGRVIAYLPLSRHLTPTGKYGHPTSQRGWAC